MTFARSVLIAAIAGCGLAAYWYVWPQEADHYTMEERMIAREITAPGVLTANRRVTITAKTPGFLSAINVDRNDVVRQGQRLAAMDNAELRSELEAAQANQKATGFMMEEAEVEGDRAIKALELANEDFGRQTALFESKTISRASFDASSINLLNSKAAVLKAKAAIEQAKARAVAAEATAAALSARLAETDIRSPIDGVVVSRNKTIGDLLAPGAELFEIIDPASIVVSARFDESTIGILKPGQAAIVAVSTLDSDTLNGEVQRVMREVDPETREFIADIKLEKLPGSWAIGQRATVSVITDSARPGLAIPQKLVVRQGGRPGAWVLRHGRAHWVQVELGYVNGTSIEIRQGLSARDVVLDPAGRFEWQRVKDAKAAP
jgi:HlyD family secretion protein